MGDHSQQLGQQPGILVAVVVHKALHGALTPLEFACGLILGHQPGNRRARIAAEASPIVHHAALAPPEGAVFEPPQGALKPPVVLGFARDGYLHHGASRQERTYIVQVSDLLVVHISNHGWTS